MPFDTILGRSLFIGGITDHTAFAHSPGCQKTADIFWAIIMAYSFGLATQFNKLI